MIHISLIILGKLIVVLLQKIAEDLFLANINGTSSIFILCLLLSCYSAEDRVAWLVWCSCHIPVDVNITKASGG